MEEEGVELHPTSSNAGRSVDGAQREETHYTGDPLIPYTGQRRFTTLGAERFHRLRRSSSDTRLPRLDIDEDDAYTACGTDLLVSAGGDSSTEASPGAADSQESLYVSDQQEGREGDKDRESASSPSNYQYRQSTSSRPARHNLAPNVGLSTQRRRQEEDPSDLTAIARLRENVGPSLQRHGVNDDDSLRSIRKKSVRSTHEDNVDLPTAMPSLKANTTNREDNQQRSFHDASSSEAPEASQRSQLYKEASNKSSTRGYGKEATERRYERELLLTLPSTTSTSEAVGSQQFNKEHLGITQHFSDAMLRRDSRHYEDPPRNLNNEYHRRTIPVEQSRNVKQRRVDFGEVLSPTRRCALGEGTALELRPIRHLEKQRGMEGRSCQAHADGIGRHDTKIPTEGVREGSARSQCRQHCAADCYEDYQVISDSVYGRPVPSADDREFPAWPKMRDERRPPFQEALRDNDGPTMGQRSERQWMSNTPHFEEGISASQASGGMKRWITVDKEIQFRRTQASDVEPSDSECEASSEDESTLPLVRKSCMVNSEREDKEEEFEVIRHSSASDRQGGSNYDDPDLEIRALTHRLEQLRQQQHDRPYAEALPGSLSSTRVKHRYRSSNTDKEGRRKTKPSLCLSEAPVRSYEEYDLHRRKTKEDPMQRACSTHERRQQITWAAYPRESASRPSMDRDRTRGRSVKRGRRRRREEDGSSSSDSSDHRGNYHRHGPSGRRHSSDESAEATERRAIRSKSKGQVKLTT